MAKGYWICNLDITEPKVHARYIEANAAAFKAYKGRFVVRGGTQSIREGTARSRQVVIEFDDYATALACYESDLYQAAKKLREGISPGSLVIVEGA